MTVAATKRTPIEANTTRVVDGREFLFRLRTCPVTGRPFMTAVAGPLTDGRYTVCQGLNYSQSPGEEFQAIVNRYRVAVVNFLPVDAYGAEVQRMRDAGFGIQADLLEKNRPEDQPIPVNSFAGLAIPIDPEVLISQGVRAIYRLGSGDLLPYLKRHAGGDWGSLGTLREIKPTLTDDHRAIPAHYPPTIRNAVALETGFGVMRSSYPVGRDIANRPTNSWEGGDPSSQVDPTDTLEIASLLVPGQSARTIVFTASRG